MFYVRGVLILTKIFYVRHSECDHNYKDTVNRPLTEKGKKDSALVKDFLSGKNIECVFSSPYKRAIETIEPFVNAYRFDIKIVEDLRERGIGEYVDDFLLFTERQWKDFDYKKYGGESLAEVQNRNIIAINDILDSRANQNIVIAGHGTALSTILNYYDNSFSYKDFLKLLPKTPYIVEFIFEGRKLLKNVFYDIITV